MPKRGSRGRSGAVLPFPEPQAGYDGGDADLVVSGEVVPSQLLPWRRLAHEQLQGREQRLADTYPLLQSTFRDRGPPQYSSGPQCYEVLSPGVLVHT